MSEGSVLRGKGGRGIAPHEEINVTKQRSTYQHIGAAAMRHSRAASGGWHGRRGKVAGFAGRRPGRRGMRC